MIVLILILIFIFYNGYKLLKNSSESLLDILKPDKMVCENGMVLSKDNECLPFFPGVTCSNGTCSKCKTNTYQLKNDCIDCPIGSCSTTGSTACIKCAPGNMCSHYGTCIPDV